ncbi:MULTISPECIES: TetR/AcrR family transcriptional regulator [unclassified Modestobacter]|uniref:TetR/AcrR family transcriptional regulator n=1 Tax=unclassified Modestobacter TaxID=2643866 RepID=UPI0022AA766F|nr:MULTISPECIES: TetR/AcrR family transcriptional regulator [unclassified Modestobacter]MCZ2825819.1 helix-turn-helix domain containing protein [Modestobacter sp. VKM Ac-2981]MCZ2853116.1 helix-turn-helix domain containing protein [Modestobacter sp. VKM Ac-2982]
MTAGASARRSTATDLLADDAAAPDVEPTNTVARGPAGAPAGDAEPPSARVVPLPSRPPVPAAVLPTPVTVPPVTAPPVTAPPVSAPTGAASTSAVEPNTTERLPAEPTAEVPADRASEAAGPQAADAADASGPGRRARRRERRGPDLREQRRLRTREAIVDAAAELFAARGFDHVSVLEIAQRAGVVEKTVFNHFPVKEGLVFEADPPMRAALLDAVRRRPAGESAATAAGSFVVAAVSQLGSPAAAEGVAEMARVIRASRTLQAREREILGALTDTLAEQITLETRASAGELEPWLAANAVMGLYSALLELARDRVLAGASGQELVAELRARGRRGLALLQFGLAGYAKRP